MKKFITTILSLAAVSVFSQEYSDRVGINTYEPKATLEVLGKADDATKADGLIVPILTRAQLIEKTAYGDEQIGTIIYVSEINGTLPENNPALAAVTAQALYFFGHEKKWVKMNR
ncbi:hypothetical protein SAMN05443429_101213 [Cruoricaptor ignavus]|uniref:Uncharacterized protein n=1 Tax=Cruoricaptor ignavus TaxID=1118202 RepID=A0A1M6AA35_9FLAO|nr:hypothetical protein [Cruoricaptor ignavus]SHI33319.1 hypothetical protein SAMN05443429_101213 [Cruoricaptor ignavus]